jgi:D-alanyl-D-alanine carboxypeptidase
LGADPADARHRRKHGHRHAHAHVVKRVAYRPPYAAIVVDANSGRVLHAENADSLRHPASVTKVMTLYLLFEQLEAGRLKLDTDLPVSAHASIQAPSKLGLRPGQTIEVEDAIKAVVTKSANDVAVVIAEAIGGSEAEFARMMTRKARQLGMSKTTYVNASGLPDDDQITTARDQALLGRAIQERFPRYYRYFSTRVFSYKGRAIGNHNHLLGRVDGVDGIKTGYVRASGFNLLASMRRDGRHLVAVVMGGTSGGARDARMRQLLEGSVRLASVGRSGPAIAEAPPMPRAPERPVAQKPIVVASATPELEPEVSTRGLDLPPPAVEAPTRGIAPRKPPVAEGSADPIRPILVRTIAVKRGGAHTAKATPAPAGDDDERETVTSGNPSTRGGWMIQVGAFPEESVAKDRLKAVKTVARSMLASAEPFTMRVVTRAATLYRARFAGLARDEAEATCKYLKRNDIACLALKN